ncbi:MAG TPA: hypothetical protein VHN14_34540 [Kofleriaceae bacterium]|nr:hypothetical protein [Kofleriaceae bacterium]
MIASVNGARTPRTPPLSPIQVLHTRSRVRRKVQRLAVRRTAAGPLPDVAYERDAALVICQAAWAVADA